MTVRILTGDCRDVLRTLPDASVDSIVTDPPYHLTTGKKGGSGPASVNLESPHGRSRVTTGFMGMKWDGGDVAFQPEVWAECLRVLKPGGHLLAFSGTRTYHRMVCAIEDAGFEIRDQIGWVYASGFPKSLDVSKAIDKAAGHVRATEYVPNHANNTFGKGMGGGKHGATSEPPVTAAAAWQGWGTALKPAWEPICVARKPLVGTVAANVLAHGTGALNIDGCRVDANGPRPLVVSDRRNGNGVYQDGLQGSKAVGETTAGRWPANLIHDGSDEVLAAFPDAPGQQADESRTAPSEKTSNVYGRMRREGESSADSDNKGVVGFKMKPGARRLDAGSAARFFYCAKADKDDRGEGNTHPTVKPAALMQYLCRLVTPPGGTVLDPFAGSGSTLLAADREGFHAIGIELNPEYADMARRRIHSDAPLLAEVEA